MVKDDLLHDKRGWFVLQRSVIRFASPFLFSVIIGVLYAWLIVNETTLEYLNIILPSTDGADLHQYLPIILPAFIFSYVVQRKHMIWIENISFSCIQVIIAFLSLVASLVVVWGFMSSGLL
ncbi:hypothetical protein [Paenibacillus amylolyticus]|uniref:hypothetical protein n=1 Tax=Paenibacillus amylolyticus TaxID=1451 RepID=UPI003EBB3494